LRVSGDSPAGAGWGELALAAQRRRFEHLATAPVAETLRRPGLLAVATAVASNTENGVVCSGLEETSADSAIEDVVGWFRARRLPASWLCDDDVEPADLRERLVRHGCRPERDAVEMGSTLVAGDDERVGRPPGVAIARVGDPRRLDAWLEVASACELAADDEDRRARRRLYLSLGLERDRLLRHYVASRGRTPVGLASLFLAGETAMLEHVTVVPDERRRGIGRALARARLVVARRAGCRYAVLAPSPEGAALYGSLGFTAAPTPPDRWYYLPLDQPSVDSHVEHGR
jgi:GNAT superfamily N-acetyltransferase